MSDKNTIESVGSQNMKSPNVLGKRPAGWPLDIAQPECTRYVPEQNLAGPFLTATEVPHFSIKPIQSSFR